MRQLLLIFLAFVSLTLCGQNIPDKPTPPRLVNDFAGVMSADQVQQLENTLVKFEKETSTQVAVVTVTSLDGSDAANYAFQLGEKWGIGQKGKNNGILILVKPKYGNDRGHAYIATGYGLEGAVPDAYANRIVDKEMIPNFKQNDYFKGIESAVMVIMQLTKGEFTAEAYANKRSFSAGPIIVLVLIILFFVFSSRAKSSSKNYSRGGSNLPFWLLLGGMAAGSSRSHGGSWGSFSSGSGGFGGFGGGSFGGGGAGGSW
jgi:uncharacterized protein